MGSLARDRAAQSLQPAQESMFHNYLVFTDADSLGLFEQRVKYYSAPAAANPAG